MRSISCFFGEVRYGEPLNQLWSHCLHNPVLDLQFQDVAAPAVGDGFADIEVADGRIFDHLKELYDLTPGQLRNRLFRN